MSKSHSMDPLTISVLVILALASLGVLSSWVMVSPHHAALIGYCGKISRVVKEGFHWVPIPYHVVPLSLFSGKPSETYIDLRERELDWKPFECRTKDLALVKVDVVAFLSVTDPQKALSSASHPGDIVKQIAETTIYDAVSKLTWSEASSSVEVVNRAIDKALNMTFQEESKKPTSLTDTYGIKTRIRVQNISVDEKLQSAMTEANVSKQRHQVKLQELEQQKQLQLEDFNRGQAQLEFERKLVEKRREIALEESKTQIECERLATEAEARALGELTKAGADSQYLQLRYGLRYQDRVHLHLLRPSSEWGIIPGSS